MVNIYVILRAVWIIRNIFVFYVIGTPVDEKELCHLLIFFVSGVAIELVECQLNFLMPRCHKRGGLFGDEGALNAIAVSLHNLQKTVSARCLVIGNRRLDQVPRTVKLMMTAILEDIFRFDLLVLGIQISVRTLCLSMQSISSSQSASCARMESGSFSIRYATASIHLATSESKK